MSDLKEVYKECRNRRKKARDQMVVCDDCGSIDGYKRRKDMECFRCGSPAIVEKGAKKDE